ncbi:MAG TPA: di-heme oxidoredictase family protein, partial [Opitutus sp.]|nr:di-heme oxidoredictase family protein [Opitutus sp.]
TGTTDDQPDPRDGRADIDRVAVFMRYLAPPNRAPGSPDAQAGQQLFATLNCAACHHPAYRTGVNPVAALSEKNVVLYSDLLLHDMGALGDGIAQADAGPREMRTAPLWGLRVRPAFLHDGRAMTLDAAIRAHDGEAAVSRDAYTQLTTGEQRQLLAFLNTL